MALLISNKDRKRLGLLDGSVGAPYRPDIQLHDSQTLDLSGEQDLLQIDPGRRTLRLEERPHWGMMGMREAYHRGTGKAKDG